MSRFACRVTVLALLVVVWPVPAMKDACGSLRVTLQTAPETEEAQTTDSDEEVGDEALTDESPAEGLAVGGPAAEPSEEAALPGPLLIVSGALVAGLVLLLLLWVILRGGGSQKAAKN